MAKTEVLSLDLLRIDSGTQSRVAISDDVITDYCDVLAESKGAWPFPPLDVFCDGCQYYVADGFHRYLSARKHKRSSVPCNVHNGTSRDARIFGMTANDKHGLRMTRADKRCCIEWLLDTGRNLLQKEIAEKAGVSLRLVTTVVAERKALPTPATPPVVATNAHIARLHPTIAGMKPPTTKSAPESVDYGKCPNCFGTKWEEDDDGMSCSKCHHPHGEPAGDVDDDRLKIQRSKTVKTAESLMRAFDDLNDMLSKTYHNATIDDCKALIVRARGWK